MTERVTSGIPGLDDLIEGGFVRGSSNMIAGQTGTCKTIFGIQFLLEGARVGESGVYLTLEQAKEDIIADVSGFGWNKEIERYKKEGRLAIESMVPTDLAKITEAALAAINRIKAKRFVLDSLSIATLGWKVAADVGKIRMQLVDLMSAIKSTGVTALFISEIPETDVKALSRLGIEEFLVDSVLILHYLEYTAGGVPRSLVIRKMRRTAHGTDVYPLEVTKRGLVVRKPRI